MATICYSYVRFSSPEQAKGDSLRRQTEAANEWAKRNGLRLDTTLTLHDLGRSAFKGEHRSDPSRHALAIFLDLIKRGRIAKGSYLIVENMDRLSRESPVHAIHLLSGILVAGVQVVQLRPNELILTDHSNLFELLQGQMNQERGHNESQMKSERVGAAWGNRREKVRESGEILTRRLPAWVRERDGELELIPEAATAVRRIYHFSANGFGTRAIIRRLVEEGIKPIGRTPRWNPAYVWNILNDRRAVGELQPKRNGEPDGPPIPDYFPAVVTEAEYASARVTASRKIKRPGKTSYYVNAFAGLVRNVRDGESYVAMTRNSHGRKLRILVALSGIHGRSSQYSLPFDVFERAVVSGLREVDPVEVLGLGDGPDEVMALSDQLATVESRRAEIEEQLMAGESVTLSNVARRLEEQQRELAEKLALARANTERPLAEAWGEARDLLAIGELDNDDRTRLQAILRRIVESIWLLVIPHPTKQERIALFQFWFKDSTQCRSFFLFFRPPSRKTPGHWWCRSLPSDLDLDLRTRPTAGAIARWSRVLAEAGELTGSGDVTTETEEEKQEWLAFIEEIKAIVDRKGSKRK